MIFNGCCGKCLRNMKAEGITLSIGSKRNNEMAGNNNNNNENEEKINDAVGFTFVKIFPSTISNIEEISKIRDIERVVYTICHCGSYNFWVFTVGIVFSFGSGVLFGALEFFNLWFLHPLKKILKIIPEPIAKMFGDMLDNMCGKCLRNLKAERIVLNFDDDIKKDD